MKRSRINREFENEWARPTKTRRKRSRRTNALKIMQDQLADKKVVQNTLADNKGLLRVKGQQWSLKTPAPKLVRLAAVKIWSEDSRNLSGPKPGLSKFDAISEEIEGIEVLGTPLNDYVNRIPMTPGLKPLRKKLSMETPAPPRSLPQLHNLRSNEFAVPKVYRRRTVQKIAPLNKNLHGFQVPTIPTHKTPHRCLPPAETSPTKPTSISKAPHSSLVPPLPGPSKGSPADDLANS